MGCIGSRLVLLRSRRLEGRRRSHSGPNVFAVLNVDDMSRHISPGKLEVTETDLVLHLRGKAPLTWPLRCLRRYGYEEDLFSFESGRRCPTGAGIYAFKCNRAQSLFNLLQSKIQGTNPQGNNAPVPSTPITPNSTNNLNNMSPTFDYVNISENSLARDSVDSEGVASRGLTHPHGHKLCQQMSITELDEGNGPLYMNVDGGVAPTTKSSSHHLISELSSSQILPGLHNKADWPPNKNNFSSQSSGGGVGGANSSVVYTNVDCSAGTPKRASEINYAELDLQTDHLKNASNIYSNFSSATKSKHLTFATGGGGGDLFNLKLKNGETSSSECRLESPAIPSSGLVDISSSVAPPPRKGGSNSPKSSITATTTTTANHSELGYATIDFDRTAALSIVTRSKIKLDFSCPGMEAPVGGSTKKNRHNSTAL